MKKITTQDFIRGLEAIEALNPVYEWGGKGLNGKCDCIGLAIGAFRQAGFSWPGQHGTNYAARYSVNGLSPYKSQSQLLPGAWLFTARKPGSGNYALPQKYQKGGGNDTGDYNDYSHVYFVLNLNPMELIHCTKDSKNNGVVRIAKVPPDRYVAYSNYIDYGLEEEPKQETPTANTALPLLKEKAVGPMVKALQQGLIDAGYPVGIAKADGVFGANTQKGVKVFQKDKGLKVDGIVGQKTWQALLQTLDTAAAQKASSPLAHLTLVDIPEGEAYQWQEKFEAMGYKTEITYG